ncbi:class I SAM-dependent methyltransferase [Cohnella abietis]|uniref:Methyltransferase n=1 Tax=Cohnella abietis TaxID=2507935 RepID=A0A3T1D2U4_9BACL|nr:class I SAM-dependent methyltransferase [Cohnella abietis]BBI32427.1 methyltransferase [Cohnella abietis]
MGDWFTESFGEDYKVVYRHRNWENAMQEVSAMMGWIGLEQGSSVLDVGCGMGRHALALKGLGYNVTGLDLSKVLLEEARENDPEESIVWVNGDMRCLPFEDQSFEATVNLFTSFGYFKELEDNAQVLGEIERVLKPQGRYLIDFLNPSYLIKHLVPVTERVDEPTGLQIIEKRTIDAEFVVKHIEIKPPLDGVGNQAASRHYVERVRLISLEQFQMMLSDSGLILEKVYGSYDGSTYAEESSERLILTGRRTI